MAVASRANNFNLIRLILASLVILAHSPELIDGDKHRELASRFFGSGLSFGDLAVDGFFFLSGYLIAMSWAREPSLWPYLFKRARRIYPGFIVACLVSCLCIAPLGTNPNYWRDFQVGAFLKGVLTLGLPNVPVPFVGMHMEEINGSLWTIRYEFACYLMLAVLGMAGLLGRRRAVLALAIAALGWEIAQSSRWIPSLGERGISSVDVYWFPRLASFYLAGVTFYLFRDRIRFTRVGVLASVVILLVAMFRYKSAALALPWLGGYLLLAAGFSAPVPGTEIIRREDVSYGTYLYAWPIQELFIMQWRTINPWLLCAITVPLAMAAGWISWRLVEGPAMRWKWGRPSMVPKVATAIAPPE
jgi:peptidoglycan/LPS O-acetylase OafA/YrhL